MPAAGLRGPPCPADAVPASSRETPCSRRSRRRRGAAGPPCPRAGSSRRGRQRPADEHRGHHQHRDAEPRAPRRLLVAAHATQRKAPLRSPQQQADDERDGERDQDPDVAVDRRQVGRRLMLGKRLRGRLAVAARVLPRPVYEVGQDVGADVVEQQRRDRLVDVALELEQRRDPGPGGARGGRRRAPSARARRPCRHEGRGRARHRRRRSRR